MSVDLATARGVFDRRVRAWLDADADAYLACWTDDLEITVPGRDEPITGKDRYARLVRGSFAWARPLAFTVHHLALDGDVVLAEWTLRAARRADDVVVEWRGASSCGLADDGRIRWWREYHHAPPAPVAD